MRRILLVLVFALILPSVSFGQVRGLFNILGGALSQSNKEQSRDAVVKEYFRRKEEADKKEVARLYKYILTTQTEKYLQPDWRTRTSRQQLLTLQTHIQWLEKLSDEGYLNPEEYLKYIARQNAKKEKYDFSEVIVGEDTTTMQSGNVTKNIKIDENIRKKIISEMERRGYKGTQIRFDFDDGYGGIELVIVRLVYKGKDYGFTKGLNSHPVKTEPGLGIGGIDKDGKEMLMDVKEAINGFEITAQEIIKKKTILPKR